MLDADKISGQNLTLGIGTGNEDYEGIGRGKLNIEYLPVYRDEQGGIATPTSDSVRTMISANTKRILLLINGYDGDLEKINEVLEYANKTLISFANAQKPLEIWTYRY